MTVKQQRKLLIGWVCASTLCACATTPQPDPALESARAAVQAAASDPNVSAYAPLDLQSAKEQLALAEDAALHHKTSAVAQPAYLAAQNARLAQVRGAAKADDARISSGQAERDRIQLEARNREVANAKAAAEQATAQSARLQAEIDQLKAAQTARGLVITFGDVLFDTGKAELNPGAKPRLDQLARFLAAHPDRRVQIDGFTDNVGTDPLNQDLSRRRAEAVASSLLARGIDGSRIGTAGYGKAFPVASNGDASGRQLNRRVEVVVGNDDGTLVAPRGR